ncbi:MAG TPA: TAXI family TRAP transporter solute-binding subunit [Rhodospirillales bacterium]|nr:TAXI family TRAP transporter solute-binding subunit [Rhodospirillales bacterium]
MRIFRTAALAVVAAIGLAGTAGAETRITYKSAKAGTSYYQMAVELAEAVKKASEGAVIVTVEESQGSVQNVKEAAVRTGNYVFTSPPGLIKRAMAGKKPFAPKNPAFDNLRSLFPIPSLTMHFVVRADRGIESFADLAGKTFLIGKGSFGAREAKRTLELFGVEGVDLVDSELSNAVAALKNGQIDGFATAGSWPAPNVVEAAASVPVRILSMSDEQVAKTGRTKLVIPAGTYPGVDYDVVTTSLPVGAYTVTGMEEEAAYLFTKYYWETREQRAGASPWWKGVTPDGLVTLAAPLHPGARRYYEEAGFTLPANLR